MRKINILWFDDDLRPLGDGNTEERLRLQVWLRWFKTGDRPERFNLVEVRDLVTLRSELIRRAEKPASDVDHIDAFLIDIFWRSATEPGSWNFRDLDQGFERERVLPLDAGAQLIGLMLNERYSRHRPPWLTAFQGRPIAVLTTLTDHRETLEKHVDVPALGNIAVLVKTVVMANGVEPDRDFCSWIGNLRPRQDRLGAGQGAAE
jgi:hypothetical protein